MQDTLKRIFFEILERLVHLTGTLKLCSLFQNAFFNSLKDKLIFFFKGPEIKKPGKLEVLPGFNAVGEGLEPSRGS